MQVLLAETHRSANELAHKLLHIYDMRYNIIELKIMIENVRDTIYYIAVVTTRQKNGGFIILSLTTCYMINYEKKLFVKLCY